MMSTESTSGLTAATLVEWGAEADLGIVTGVNPGDETRERDRRILALLDSLAEEKKAHASTKAAQQE